MKERRFLYVALVVLLVLLLGLVWLYSTLSAPLKPVTATKPKGLEFLFQVFGPSENDRFEKPTDVAVDRNGNIYVSDTLKNRIAVFDSEGKFLRQFKTDVIRPLGIDVGPDGTLYVVSKRDDTILALSSKGKVKRRYKAYIPLDVVAEGKRIYVTTIGPIVSFDIATGENRRLFGWNGREKDEFAWPNSIASRGSRLYVADTNNLSLKSVSTTGSVHWVVGKSPTTGKFTQEEGREFGAPAGVALDESGRIFVVDAFRDTVYLYDAKGKLITEFGGERGDAEGQFDHPAGIAYAGEDIIYVVDKFNNRVQAFRVSVPGQGRALVGGIPLWWCLIPLLLLILLLLLAWVIRRAKDRRQPGETTTESEQVQRQGEPDPSGI